MTAVCVLANKAKLAPLLSAPMRDGRRQSLPFGEKDKYNPSQPIIHYPANYPSITPAPDQPIMLIPIFSEIYNTPKTIGK